MGKTAVAGHLARLLAETRDVVVVAMGRGGPPDPVVVEEPPDAAALLELARAGSHAASDYLEDAALARVTTVGCRRCGGGLAGAPFVSNVEAGARAAAELGPELVIFEGSGAALPPVETSARVLVAGGAQDPELVAGYLGAYRILLSDLVVLTGCEEPRVTPEQVARLRERDRRRRSGRPGRSQRSSGCARPSRSRAGRSRSSRPRRRRCTTGCARRSSDDHGAARHARLRQPRPPRRAAGRPRARRATPTRSWSRSRRRRSTWSPRRRRERGIDTILCDNAVEALAGEPDLDDALAALADAAARTGAAA